MVTEAHRVAAVRSFNRFWTKQIGVLQAGLLDTSYSLTEARLIFELAQRSSTVLTDLSRDLGLDPGYVSRILNRFKSDGLVRAEPSPADARRQVLTLTDRGRAVFEELDRRSAADVEAMLSALSEEDQRRLLGAMATIEDVLVAGRQNVGYVIRPLLPGDLGWVVHRHGVLYAEEYGWDATFEALVARVVADYVDQHDSALENAWIAELDGEPVGSVFCCKREHGTAQLRLLLVEPKARGLGLGTRLVHECIRFAQRVGYDRVTLWTNDVLDAARRIYEAAGFRLVEEHAHHSFGHDLVGQNWELLLPRARAGRRRP